MIGRAATAQDDIVGDGTTSNVLFIGELMRQAERYLGEGVHPRILVDGIEIGKKETLAFLEQIKIAKPEVTKELLMEVAKASLMTKVHPNIANPLTEIIVDAVNTIRKDDKIDLHMIEIMHMQHKMSTESRLIKGLVLDHGGRHENMPSRLENCYIMSLNVSLEYEKTEVHSGFFWSNADQREKLIASERAFTDDKVLKIIELKKKLCDGTNKNFVIINQKGIDPPSLELLAREGIIGIRRAKRRNLERIPLACGGKGLNSVEDMSESDLGFAKLVYEVSLGDDKYTFIEGVENPFSCTILIKGPNDYSIAQTKDAIRDGLRAVQNTYNDKAVIPGAGAFEVAAHRNLINLMKEKYSGKVKLGIQAFADSLLVIPRTLAENSGFDPQETLLKVVEAHEKSGEAYGVDVITGEA
jgi:T-complex protein 1 subunit zeta